MVEYIIHPYQYGLKPEWNTDGLNIIMVVGADVYAPDTMITNLLVCDIVIICAALSVESLSLTEGKPRHF